MVQVETRNDQLIWGIQCVLREAFAIDSGLYKMSPGQLQDHVHNRIARLVAAYLVLLEDAN